MKKIIAHIVILLIVQNISLASNNAKNTPYVIVVSLDGFRWDYLQRDITPNLQRIIEQGVKSESLQPCFPSKTFPNHISIMTAMYPENHGIIANKFSHPITQEFYSLSDTQSVSESKWYKGEFFWETLSKNDIISASYFWPGSEISDATRRPTYFEHYNHNTPFTKVLDTLKYWLNLPPTYRPHFITLYFHEVDDAGHRFGPDCPQTNRAIKKVDTIIGKLLQTIHESSIADSINLIILSDHGMNTSDKEKHILIEKPIKQEKYRIQYDPIVWFLKPDNPSDIQKIYNTLKRHELHYKVYLKSDVPDSLHFKNNEFIYDIVAIADLGYSFVRDSIDILRIRGGNHGYNNYEKNMHGIFIAQGNLFKKKYAINIIQNIDIYPFLCHIFDIMPNRNIDGKLSKELLSTLK